MIIFKHSKSLELHLQKAKAEGKRIAFVPTMGALHQGHISLIEMAIQPNTIVIASIFVNPTQFNDPKDYDKYPKTIDQDVVALEKCATDILLLPPVEELYPDGLTQKKIYDLGFIEEVLESTFRPGHFQGVCQVVDKLLQIVQPDTLVLGQKDYQQCMVISKLISLLQIPTQLVIGKTHREADGLAMSSRNMRLNSFERSAAPLIYKTMLQIKRSIKIGSLAGILQTAAQQLTDAGFRVDYVTIANAYNLQVVNNWDGQTKLVILVAAFLNQIRLIDNMVVE